MDVVKDLSGDRPSRVSFARSEVVIPPAENYDAVDRFVFGEMRRSCRQNSMSRKRSISLGRGSVSEASDTANAEVVIVNESLALDDDDEEEEYDEHAEIAKHIEENVVGNDTKFEGPYGEKQVVYCDYTASGRAVKFIEDYITEHVQPLYANTHTTTGLMARQTTKFRKEAREIIKQCVNATDDDALIFTGSGTTGAVNKLVSALMLSGERAKKTVVLVGPYEHHSNLLPWKETGAKVVRIRDNDRGLIDMVGLEDVLAKYQKKGRHLIGCFSAASNVTGIISDTRRVAAMLHKYGALSFWDYATAGPYLAIDMNPPSDEYGGDSSKDAVYLSPHKFVGGVGTPGLLIAKKKLFLNAVPHSVGGGTVLYVTKETHHYVENIEEREEGGTPAIVESIRAGLTFRLKESVGTDYIEKREEELTKLAFLKWKKNPNLIFLGSTRANRLPIFSFMVVHPKTGKMLHHNFIAVLLNDLYGIQARGGCACAGPYAQDLLGIDEELAEQFVYFLINDKEEKESKKRYKKKNGEKGRKKPLKTTSKALDIMKPGFVRLNLPFFFSDEVIDFVLQAVDDIGENGWKMLSQYQVDPVTWEWQHVGMYEEEPKKEEAGERLLAGDSLLTTSFIQGKFNAPPSPYVTPKNKANIKEDSYQSRLAAGARIMRVAGQQCKFPEEVLTDHMEPLVSDPNMIWFMRPHEAVYHIRYPEAEDFPLLEQTTEVDFGSTGAAAGATARASNTGDARSNLTRAPFKPKRYTKRSLSRRKFSLIGKAARPRRRRKDGDGVCHVM